MLLERVTGDDPDACCGCDPGFEGDRLVLDATDCDADGTLAGSPTCRATAVGALADRDADSVVVRTPGLERIHDGEGGALLVAAGRFVDRVGFHDDHLADRARRDPLRAARAATARAGPVADLAAETGLAAVGDRVGATGAVPEVDYDRVFRPAVAPSVARARYDPRPPEKSRLLDARDLSTDATARRYGDDSGRYYHLLPVELRLDRSALATLSAAHEHLANGDLAAGDPGRAVGRAVRAVADPAAPVEVLTRVLRKHTRGYGVLTDLFADPRVSDVYATAPVEATPLRVVVDGEELRTNVGLTSAGAEAIASRLRRESGRSFSRASPTLDATATLPSGRIRAAGVERPVSDGVAFAFRDHGKETWTLPTLVGNGTLPADAAALLSVAVERSVAGLVAGSRGAGKTTLLGALLWELPAATRTVVIEDTPELPVDALRAAGRDVQGLRTALDDGPGIDPAKALRTALRLGDSALVVGEVRGEEAAVLYEAMRVGASAGAVLGTIHGDGGESVRERVTSDLGVPVSSFAVTDVVVTAAVVDVGGDRERRVGSIEEVIRTGDGVRFAPLYDLDGTDLAATGRIDRGESHLVSTLAGPDESYADLREELADRAELLSDLVDRDRTAPGEMAAAYADRGGGRR